MDEEADVIHVCTASKQSRPSAVQISSTDGDDADDNRTTEVGGGGMHLVTYYIGYPYTRPRHAVPDGFGKSTAARDNGARATVHGHQGPF